MWEIVSRGRTPYPGVHNHELLELLQSGHRLKNPEDCSPALYNVMERCWHSDPSCRPSFSDLLESLRSLLLDLPVLQASVEAGYINQGLQAATAASQEPQTDPEGRLLNVYLPSPVGAAARDEDEDSGYLKTIAE